MRIRRMFREMAHAVYRNMGTPAARNLAGDRDVEWAWTAANIPQGGGRALDFGSGGSNLGLVAALRGYRVTAVDLTSAHRLYECPGLEFLQSDLLDLDLPEASFDLVINCSSVEHVGLSGRYGVPEDSSDGDLMAMQRLRSLMKPAALMLATVPVGQDAVLAPVHRVYGERRLPRLIDGFECEAERYWIKDERNLWVAVSRETAQAEPAYGASQDPLRNLYGIGAFRLRRARNPS